MWHQLDVQNPINSAYNLLLAGVLGLSHEVGALGELHLLHFGDVMIKTRQFNLLHYLINQTRLTPTIPQNILPWQIFLLQEQYEFFICHLLFVYGCECIAALVVEVSVGHLFINICLINIYHLCRANELVEHVVGTFLGWGSQVGILQSGDW